MKNVGWVAGDGEGLLSEEFSVRAFGDTFPEMVYLIIGTLLYNRPRLLEGGIALSTG